MQEEMSEQQQQNPEPAGASARRKTILTTGLAGGSGTLLSLVTPLGPGWALGAALTTGALLFLENHGTPAEYAWVTSYLAPISRRLAARRAASRPEPKNVVALDQPRVQLVPDFQEDAMESLQPRVQSAGLPSRSPAFREMRHLMRSDVDILGFDGERFVSAASFKQAVNIAVIGVPGAGKTVCLSFHVAQSLSRRAIVRGWDIHGDVAADLGECCTILEDVDEIVADCDWIQLERESRLVARKIAKSQGKEALDRWYDNTREMVYIIDEFNALMLRLKRRKKDREIVADTLLSLIAEGRKLKMRVILSGQTMPAALFGEQGSSARDIINTKYAFQSRENHAQYFGVEASAVDALLPLIAGEDSAGYAILDGGGLLHARIVSIPYVTIEDIRAIVRELGSDLDEEEDIIAELLARRKPRADTEDLRPYHAQDVPYRVPEPRKASQPGPAVYAVPGSVYARRQDRLRRQRERPVATRTQDEDRPPEERLTREERIVLDAYQGGLKTGNAIAIEKSISSTRVNQILNKLSRLGLIDWQPRK